MLKRNFDYEQKHLQLLEKIAELRDLSLQSEIDLTGEIEALMSRINILKQEKYAHLSPWEKTLLSRHPERPGSSDFIETLCDDWIELHGDRVFGDDSAIIAGIGMIDGRPITILGHQKGRDTTENLKRNFGMPHPEGYRKIQRLLMQAEKFDRPVLTLIDTAGAYPGMGAEERGQASAIARVLMNLSMIRTPVLAVVIGQGGSGGALALGVADRILMLSNAVFSVASPEACASIMWKDLERVEEMANAMKITAADLLSLQLIDEIIEEPPGGAHLDSKGCIIKVKSVINRHLDEICSRERQTLLVDRRDKLRRIGQFCN